MAFIVEDGTGVPGANSYASVEFAVAYFAERGRSAEFDGEVGEQQAWLVQGTDYAERYRERFKGVTAFASQSLSFPRIVTAIMTVWFPDVLRMAVCEYAARAKAGPLAPDAPDAPQAVLIRKKIGPVEKSYQLVGGQAPTGRFRSYPAADALLVGLLRQGGSTRLIK
jgi:hypothetical protein